MLDVIIVLGNSRTDIMEERLARAFREFNVVYYDDETMRQKIIIPTGTPTESNYMTNRIIETGISRDCIIVDSNARNTIDNIVNSRALIEAHLLVPYRIIVCTSSFHIARTIVICGLVMGKFMEIVKFIHTNETVSSEEKQRETFLTSRLLDTFILRNAN